MWGISISHWELPVLCEDSWQKERDHIAVDQASSFIQIYCICLCGTVVSGWEISRNQREGATINLTQSSRQSKASERKILIWLHKHFITVSFNLRYFCATYSVTPVTTSSTPRFFAYECIFGFLPIKIIRWSTIWVFKGPTKTDKTLIKPAHRKITTVLIWR